MSDPLQREYGMLLTAVGPFLLQRANEYRAVAHLIKERSNGQCKAAVNFLEMQADRAEETLVSLGKAMNG